MSSAAIATAGGIIGQVFIVCVFVAWERVHTRSCRLAWLLPHAMHCRLILRPGVAYFSCPASACLPSILILQAFHLAASTAAGAASAGLPLAQRSILGGLLPESLLHMLEAYGPDQFAAALTGDSDSPELIWTHRMRSQRLVPQMLVRTPPLFPQELALGPQLLFLLVLPVPVVVLLLKGQVASACRCLTC